MNKKIILISLLLAATFLVVGCGARQSGNNSSGSNQNSGGNGSISSNQSSGQQEIDQTLQSLDQEMGSTNTSLDGSDLN